MQRIVWLLVVALSPGCASEATPEQPSSDASTDATVDTRVRPDSAIVEDTAADDSNLEDVADTAIDASDTPDSPPPGPSGSLDTTFGAGKGFRCFVFGAAMVTLTSRAQAMTIAPDGAIVLAGEAGGFAIARFTREGEIDTSFGGGGAVRYEVGAPGTATDRVFGVATTPDKKVVIGGVHQLSSLDGGSSSQAVLARVTETGAKDMTAFSGSWFVYPAYGGTQSAIRALTLVSGKLVVVGVVQSGSEQRAFIARHLDTGALDASFGVGGVRSFSFDGAKDSVAYALSVQTDGKIVVGGSVLRSTGVYHFGVARVDASGALDSTFGTGGFAHVGISTGVDAALALALQSTGSVVLAGTTEKGFGIARFTSSGALDSSFVGGGKLQTKFGIAGDWATSVLALPGDRLVLGGGNSAPTGPSKFALEGYLKDGAYDTAFGTDGLVTTKLGTSPSVVFALARQSDGRIVAGGPGDNGMCVARYWP